MEREDAERLWEDSAGGDLASRDPDATFRPTQEPASPPDERPTVVPGGTAPSSELSELQTFGCSGGGATPGEAAAWSAAASSAAASSSGRAPIHPSGEATPAAGGDVGFASASGLPGGSAGTTYELLEIIGQGGMGVVWRARQGSLKRIVAVKTIRPERDSRNVRERFLAEAVVTAVLDHPNVIAVHDLGRAPDGGALLSMKLVEGTPWARLLHPKTDAQRERAARLDLRFHLDVLLAVMNAVAYAHSRGICHLDLKPDNVMIGGYGEVLVMDWGLAVQDASVPEGERAALPPAVAITAPCGTPSYMPAELAEGRGKDVGPWTDTYLLGAILYEIVGGKAPHRGDSMLDTVGRAAQNIFEPLGPTVPAELRGIVGKALAKDPALRFQSVADMRAALAAYLEHRDSATVAEAASRALAEAEALAPGRAPAASGEPARAARYGLYAEAVAGFRQALRLWQGSEEARRGEREALLAYAAAALGAGDLGLAEAQAAALPVDDAAAARVRAKIAEARARAAEAAAHARRLRRGLASALAAIVVGLAVGFALVERARRQARDSERAATAARATAVEARHAAEASERAAQQARRAAERQLATSLVQQGDLVGRDGLWAEARTAYQEARAIALRVGDPPIAADVGLAWADELAPPPLLVIEAHEGAVSGLAITPDGDAVVSAGADGALQVFDALTGRPLGPPRRHPAPITALALARDGRAIATGDQAGRLRAFAFAAAEPAWVADGPPGGAVAAVSLGAEGGLVAAAAGHGVAILDAATGAAIRTFPYPAGATACAFAPDGKLLVTGDGAGTLRIAHVAGNPEWAALANAHRAPIRAVAFSPRGGKIASGGDDHALIVVDLDKDTRATIRAHAAPVVAIALVPAGDALTLYSLGREGVLRSFDAQSAEGEAIATLPLPPGHPTALAIHRRAGLALVGTAEGRIWLFDLAQAGARAGDARGARAAGTPIGAADVAEPGRDGRAGGGGPGGGGGLPAGAPTGVGVTATALGPGGGLVAAGHAGGRIEVYDIDSGAPVLRLDGAHDGAVTALAALDGGSQLLSAGADGALRLWSLEDGLPTHTLAVGAGPGGVRAAAVADDGRIVLAATAEGAWLLDLREREETARLGGPDATAVALDEAPVARPIPGREPPAEDDRRGFVGFGDGRIDCFGLARGEARWSVGQHPGGVSALALAKGGALLVSAGVDGSVRVWDAATGRSLGTLGTHLGPATAAVPCAHGLVATTGADSTWKLWDPAAGALVRSFPGEGALVAIAAEPDGLRFAIGARPGGLRLWDLERGPRSRALADAAVDAVRALRATADGGGAAEGGAAEPAAATEGAALAGLGRWYAHRGAHALAIAAFERARARGAAVPEASLGAAYWHREQRVAAARAYGEAVAAGGSGALRATRAAVAAEAERSGSMLARGQGVHDLRFSADGALLACAGQDGAVVVWDARTGLERVRFQEDWRSVLGVAFAPDGRSVASADAMGMVRVHPVEPRGAPLGWEAHDKGVTVIAYAPDGRRLVTGSYDRTLRVWDPSTGDLVGAVGGHGGTVRALAVSPDGAFLASGADDGLRVFELESLVPRLAPAEGDDDVDAIEWLDGRRLLVSRGRALEVVDVVGGGAVLGSLSDPTSPMHAAVAGGKRHAAAIYDQGLVQVWDIERGEVLRRISAGGGSSWNLIALAVSPDGRLVAVGVRNGEVILYPGIE